MAKETESGLRKMQFTKALRGYTCEEVDTYLAHVNDRYVAVVRECSELKKKMAVLAAGQNEFREDALREKAKIAAEADALLAEKKATANALVREAEQKAAQILSKAEAAAAGILKQAETEAAEIHARQKEQLDACQEAERQLHRHNNTADRLVAEIDAFREKVFAMYASHIEALDQLSQLTDDFYKAKEELTVDALDTPADTAEDQPAMDTDMVYEPTEDDFAVNSVTEDSVTDEPAAESSAAEEDEDLLRIDWQEHKQKQATREAIEAEQMAGKTLLEIAKVAEAHATAAEKQQEPAPTPEPDFATEEIDEIWEEPMLDTTPIEAETEPVPMPEETSPAAASTDADPSDDESDEDLLAGLERDLLSAYAKGGVNGAVDAIDALDIESLMAEESPTAAAPNEDDSEEDFLSDIASEYMTAAKPGVTTPVTPADTDITATHADDLDELLDDEQSHDVSLTGEFDKIFSSKKSAAYVDEVSRQPLVEAKKPEKPKKHK